MNTSLLGVIGCLWMMGVHAATAQKKADDLADNHIEYRDKGLYFEKIVYADKPRTYFTIYTYLKDSTLYSIETYKYVEQEGPTGFSEYVTLRHGMTKILYPNGRLHVVRNYKKGLLDGPFIVHYPSGVIKRKEFYRRGEMQKGTCYDSLGAATSYEPFLKPPTPTASLNQLRVYLEERLLPIFKRYTMQGLVQLVINQAGEVATTTCHLSKTDPLITKQVKEVISAMPRWHEAGPNWNPATVDGTPMVSDWVIQIYKQKSELKMVLPVPD
ncbi:toxin-antitoxin system YwqK family antitoxin [Fibrella sp. WM1]|uniref:toxin-antitoxin system YwqK family antitoxin n=1 Tax=Fibrella musci TaxID=3242485 RepID=UPI0035215CE3